MYAGDVAGFRANNSATIFHVFPFSDLIEHFKKDGKGWQSRLNDTLKKAVGA